MEHFAMLVCSSMSGNLSPPDYELADRRALTMPAQVKAISHPSAPRSATCSTSGLRR